MNKRVFGAKGEAIAKKTLEDKGYEIVATNFRVRAGEIDIVARKRGSLAFVEVKRRSNRMFGAALESLTGNRIKRLREAGLTFLEQNPQYTGFDIALLLVAIDGKKVSFLPVDSFA